jgi:hypothetical protein
MLEGSESSATVRTSVSQSPEHTINHFRLSLQVQAVILPLALVGGRDETTPPSEQVWPNRVIAKRSQA